MESLVRGGRRSGWLPFLLLLGAMLITFWPRPAQAAESGRQAEQTPRAEAAISPGKDGTNGTDPGALSGELAESQAGDLNLGQIEQFWNRLKNEYGGFFPQGEAPSLRQLMFPEDGKGWSVKDVLLGLARFFLHEVLYSGKLIVTISLPLYSTS